MGSNTVATVRPYEHVVAEAGTLLRLSRSTRGWTMLELVGRMSETVNLWTLELQLAAGRRMDLERFVDVCIALGESPTEVLSTALDNVGVSHTREPMRVDVARARRMSDPRMAPVRQWAEKQPNGTAHLSVDGLDVLATLCDGMPPVELARVLRYRRIMDRPCDRTPVSGT